MIDFDREWTHARRRHERAAMMVTVGVIVTWFATIAVIALVAFAGFKMAKAGPEALAAQAGRAAAAFDSARAGR